MQDYKKSFFMKIGKYFIGQNVAEIADELTEISKEEYSILKRSFDDEIIYYSNDVEYCEASWKTVVGVTKNKIYKISLQTTETHDLFDLSRNGVWNRVYDKLNNEIAMFSDQEKAGNSFLTTWDTDWGNIILNSTSLPEGEVFSSKSESVIDITITGSAPFRNKKRGQLFGFWLFSKITWNPFDHSDDDNVKWSWLRAVEWKNYPIFLSQVAFAPMLFFYGYGPTLAIIFFSNFFWGLVSTKMINLAILSATVYLTYVKWIIIVPFVIYFMIKAQYLSATLSLTYPLWCALLSVVSISPMQIGIIQKVILKKLGYPDIAKDYTPV